MKKILAIILALVMVLALAACGGGAAPAATDAPATQAPSAGGEKKFDYTIGINTWGSGVPVLDMFGNAKQFTLESVGCKVNRMSDDFTADKELQNVQNLCAAGVDGMVINAAAVSTVPQIAKECENAKIPFAFDVFVGENPDLEKLADSNGDDGGAIDLDMVYDGQVIGQMAYDAGCRKAVCIGGNIGDNNMDQRSQGFTEKFTALGGVVLSEARCTDNSECLTKASDMLSANMDADCIYCFVGDYVEGSRTALENLGLTDQVKMFVSCVDEATAGLIADGSIYGGNDGISMASYISSTLVLNYLQGNKIVDANGKAPRLSTHPFQVTQDNAEAYSKAFFDQPSPFTVGMIQALLADGASYQDYVDLIENLNLEYILKENGLA